MQGRNRRKNKRKPDAAGSRYGRRKLRHSQKGVYSCLTAAAVLALLICLVTVSYLCGGNAIPLIGACGLLVWMLSVFGIVTGIRGLRERGRRYGVCKAGIGGNGLLFLILLTLFFRGL